MLVKEEWLEWKAHPVTKAFYEAVMERIEECKEILASSAGQDAVNDRFYVGFIAAYREMMSFSVEDLDND